jgi:ketosteroid isomerase-like protein
VDHATAQSWLDRYRHAWLTYDAGLIGDLFTDDVAYRYHPYDEPVRGRSAVVASWLGASSDESASDRNEPGTYDATYVAVAVDGDTVVATGTSSYRDEAGGPVVHVFHNCFVMRFGPDRRCREFTEYYMEQR